MDMTNQSGAMRGDIQHRLEAIGARLEAASRQVRSLLRESIESTQPEEDPVQRLDVIEAKLEAMEKRLHELEAEMLDVESPPKSFAPKMEISEGVHYPGLG